MSSKVLLKILRNLSPTMKRLVNKAIQEGMQIINIKSADRRFRKRWPMFPDHRDCLATCHCPEIGLGKTIAVSPEMVLDHIRAGSLGLIERGFAHEIGHLLADIKERRSDCCRSFSKDWPSYFYCAYREIKAECIGLKQLRQVCRWNIKTHLVLFNGQKTTLFQLLGQFGYPEGFLRETYDCKALEAHCLSECPKRKKVAALVQEITRLLK